MFLNQPQIPIIHEKYFFATLTDYAPLKKKKTKFKSKIANTRYIREAIRVQLICT